MPISRFLMCTVLTAVAVRVFAESAPPTSPNPPVAPSQSSHTSLNKPGNGNNSLVAASRQLPPANYRQQNIFPNAAPWSNVGDDYSFACPSYGTQYTGKGTYYGIPPMVPNTDVRCHLPNNMFGLTTVALNNPMYNNGLSCGMCIRVFGSGNVCQGGNDPGDGSCGQGANPITGTFDAVVTDQLAERLRPDIDLGRPGDGYWPVTWMPIPCPQWSPKLVLHQGSNPYYVQVQMRYLDSPMVSMTLNGMQPSQRMDNFFVWSNMGALQFDSNGEVMVQATSMLGSKYCGSFDSQFQGQPYEYNAWSC